MYFFTGSYNKKVVRLGHGHILNWILINLGHLYIWMLFFSTYMPVYEVHEIANILSFWLTKMAVSYGSGHTCSFVSISVRKKGCKQITINATNTKNCTKTCKEQFALKATKTTS